MQNINVETDSLLYHLKIELNYLVKNERGYLSKEKNLHLKFKLAQSSVITDSDLVETEVVHCNLDFVLLTFPGK